MSVWRIAGGNRLEGSIRVQGAKNAVLPMIAASLLTGCETEFLNCPALSDVEAAVDILRYLGCKARQEDDVLNIDSRDLCRSDIPSELMHRMRSSVIFLGPLLARCGEVRASVPGGCELGPRPIDLHLEALRRLGAEVEEREGEIVCRAVKLRGAEISLSLPSVGATENAMLAACAAEGPSVIYNAAREPEIESLQEYLCRLGAKVSGAGTPVVTVNGFHPCGSVGLRVMPDRIAAATLLCCTACVGGDVELQAVCPEHLEPVIVSLAEMGCRIFASGNRLRIISGGRLRAPRAIVTRPYPGFPTDAAPLLMAVSLRAEGSTVFIENIFSSRYRHASELRLLGADISTHGSLALVNGVETLHGARLHSTDLRGGAALVAAALGAEGETEIFDEGHIGRGYSSLDGDLRRLGADIRVE
ncbi:MAG: UDP-N-acetylglucosamine 1-carboxyvinyltransferase [Eubacteriales bacterium]|nr:UDP-N-acetylglucosamine 1-carboxyvinyltransferase [Eubacteriales bacterium]